MIGVDTNILIRFFLQDDPSQNEKVTKLFARLPEIGPGYINCITLMEFAWFLRRKTKLPRSKIMEGISDLLEAEDILLEDELLVEEVLGIMASSEVEFADTLIALRNRNAGCNLTMTFDEKAAKRIPGMELLT
ncbi:PIN domain-containing protein [Rhizobium sp. CB3090]|uniref:PIN domain-containing protein n=1 Tax=Rhizobium sp. CB3090 TaxID=3039156 RepID=UPI0024B04A5C|nr:PIN domain-containing protein [Rhizobium sp. CB3090]WFU08116.1 PIN domain-containing protein [Rhizobium sp. CB3090]